MVVVCVAHIIVSNFSVFFAFKMSRSSVNKNLSDRYVILLDESLKENQALREELKEREAQNVAKIERLSSKVNTLYQLLEKADHTSGKGKRTSNISSNVHCNVTNSDIIAGFKTDHSLITIKLSLQTEEVQGFGN